MKLSLIFIFSLIASVAPGQTDTLKSSSTSLEFAVDYGKILTIPSKFETKFEGSIGLKFQRKYELLGEIGYADLQPQDAILNGTYQSKGVYYRIGLAFGGEILPKNFLSFGVLYGTSSFEDNGTVVIRSTIWEDFNEYFERTGLSANWIEFVMITEQHVNNSLSLGAKFRLRKLTYFINDYNPEVISIPGYGKAFNNSIPVINLYAKLRLDF